jgi:NADP-dependent 3-hydroxy acid dehydrogenase YdfG
MNLESTAIQSPIEWQKQFDVNCVGLLNMTSVIFPRMIERKGGTIVNIGSTAGKNTSEFHTAYNGTKFAVHAMTEALRREGQPHKVRVSLVAPGLTETDLSSGTNNLNILNDREEYKANIGGALNAETVAEAILFIYQQPHNVCIRDLTIAPTGQIA